MSDQEHVSVFDVVKQTLALNKEFAQTLDAGVIAAASKNEDTMADTLALVTLIVALGGPEGLKTFLFGVRTMVGLIKGGGVKLPEVSELVK